MLEGEGLWSVNRKGLRERVWGKVRQKTKESNSESTRISFEGNKHSIAKRGNSRFTLRRICLQRSINGIKRSNAGWKEN